MFTPSTSFIRIAVYQGKPFYFTDAGIIDWIKLIQALCNVISEKSNDVEQVSDNDVFEWIGSCTIKGKSPQQWMDEYGFTVWKYNPVMNDFVSINF
mgnify:CR=1 FL=1